MTRNELIEQIRQKQSFLCIGLDSDISKIPVHLQEANDPVFEFNKGIIDASHDLVIAYKINTAFYECRSTEGWKSLEKTINYINNKFPEIFTIADAKRGDIGNTSRQYAKAFFEHLDFDAVTVAPYMGEDSISPFLEFDGKWIIILALTSNKGAYDFQFIENKDGTGRLFENVIKTSRKWGDEDKIMYVAGATQAEILEDVRKIAPSNFLLVPGVGAQGGDLEKVAEHGMTYECGLIVNSSRKIIFASKEKDFAEKAREKALELHSQMSDLLRIRGVVD